MTLHLRIALFISIIFALLAASLFAVFNFAIVGGYLELEGEEVSRNVARVHETLGSFQSELALKAEEWGAWDDTYQFMDDSNESYSSSNLTFAALSQLLLNHFIIINLESEPHTTITVTEEEAIHEIEAELLSQFKELAQAVIDEESAVSSLITIDERVFVVGAAPVTDSAAESPIKGAIIFTRLFDAAYVEKLEEITRVSVEFSFPENISILSEQRNGFELLDIPFQYGDLWVSKTDSEIEAISTVVDYFKKPVLIARMNQSRALFAKGLETRNVVTGFILLFTFVALGASILFLRRWVVQPLRSLGEQSEIIGRERRYDLRVSVKADEEIQELANAQNHMMAELSDANDSVLKAQHAAEAANLSKSIFIARVSHELRNPAGGILGINRMLAKQPDVSAASRELLHISNSAATNMVSIINEILDYSKIESGELILENESFSLRAILKETMQVIAGRMSMNEEEVRDVKLLLDVPPLLPDYWIGDGTRLQQVLINLAGNALKFTVAGNVGVRVREFRGKSGESRLSFSIWDTGSGISKDKQARVFEPFKHSEEGNRKAQGTGLGLAIVKEFVRKFGGDVHLKSAPGKGSVFRFTIPMQEDKDKNNGTMTWKKFPRELDFIAYDTTEARLLEKNASVVRWSLRTLSRLPEMSDEYWQDAVTNLLRKNNQVVIAGEHLEQEWFWKLIIDRTHELSTDHAHTIVLLEASELRHRDRLYEIGLRTVITAPICTDEILRMAKGSSSVVKEQIATSSSESDEQNQLLENKGSLRILLADDALTNRLVMEDMLRDEGHQVVCVKDGQELLDAVMPGLQKGKPDFDLIVTDVTMPKVDGCEATRHIRKAGQEISIHLPIVAITAHALQEEQEEIYKAGVDGIVCKPVSPEAMSEVISQVVPSKGRNA